MCLGVLFIRIYLFFSVHLVNIKGGECSNVQRNESQNLSESNTKSIHRTKYREYAICLESNVKHVKHTLPE